ncbi:MAG: ADP-ribosylglycohydrolase family protein [Rectinemataceae bacterium]
MQSDMYSRAQGALLGLVAGDSLGSLVEFQSPQSIRRLYPQGLRDLVAGGTFDTLPGQPTDDSEMALLLARSLIELGTYDAPAVRERYVYWLESGPFDCGLTISAALRGTLNEASQANGALMRVSPVGIAGAKLPLEAVARWAELDAGLTHPNPVCLQVNALYAMSIAIAIREEIAPKDLFERIQGIALERCVEASVMASIEAAAVEAPANFLSQMGWVLIAFQNALYQLLHAPSLELGIIDTVMRGGDTDTNAAISGALLGAVHGREAIPRRWEEAILACRPKAGLPGVHRPRPECLWPTDLLSLAARLVDLGG